MPGSVLKGIKKRASSIKNAIRGRRYTIKDAESDTWSLSSDGSTTSYTIRGSSGRGNSHFQERSLSEDELNRQAGKRRNATRRLSLGDEQFDDHKENMRKCWSEDKIAKPTKKTRVISQFKSFLCVIPELEHAHDEHLCKTHYQAKDSRESLSEATFHGDNSAWFVHSADDLLGGDANNEHDEVFEERPDGDIDWNATGARPKDFKDQGTSSGISSLRPKLPEGNEGPMMTEFMNSLENSPSGRSASSKFQSRKNYILIQFTNVKSEIRKCLSHTLHTSPQHHEEAGKQHLQSQEISKAI